MVTSAFDQLTQNAEGGRRQSFFKSPYTEVLSEAMHYMIRFTIIEGSVFWKSPPPPTFSSLTFSGESGDGNLHGENESSDMTVSCFGAVTPILVPTLKVEEIIDGPIAAAWAAEGQKGSGLGCQNS